MSGTKIAVSMLAVALAGCSYITSNDYDGLVEVVADIAPGGEGAVVTIRNESDRTILLRQPCVVGLDFRDGGEWQSLPVNCPAVLLGPKSIDPADELVFEWSFGPELAPGEYRFGAALMDANENLARGCPNV